MHRYVAGVKRVVGSLPNNGPPGRPAPEPEHLFARATPPCGTTAGHIRNSCSRARRVPLIFVDKHKKIQKKKHLL